MKIKLAALAVSIYTASLFAQVGSSTISGRVTDSTGAVVSNVKVLAVQTATNFNFNAITNTDGLFRIPSLSPGDYKVTFELPGFKRIIRENVDLRTGDNLAVDVTLQVGNTSESVEVTGTTPLLETETSATGSLV
jgi:Carboxypeptidase regulatory-like domain